MARTLALTLALPRDEEQVNVGVKLWVLESGLWLRVDRVQLGLMV